MPVRVKRKQVEYYDKSPYTSCDGDTAVGRIEHIDGTGERLFVLEKRVTKREYAQEWAKAVADMLGGKGKSGVKGETIKTLERILLLVLENRSAVERAVEDGGKGIALRFSYDALPEELKEKYAPSCYYTGFRELLDRNVLACSTEDCVYFLNPQYLLRGEEHMIATRLVLEES